MINFKKMDDKDFVFINKPLNKEEEESFSDFLKSRKEKKNKPGKNKKAKAISLQ